MKTRHFAAIAVLASALAGCGSSDNVTAKNASVEEVAREVAKSDLKPNPGRWETSVTVDGKAMPGPAAAQGPMATCLTPADVDKMGEAMMQKPMESCRYESFEMAGGKVNGVMACSPPGMDGGTMRMTMDGAYTADTYEVDMTTTISMGGSSRSNKMRITSRRVGACDGSEIKAPPA